MAKRAKPTSEGTKAESGVTARLLQRPQLVVASHFVEAAPKDVAFKRELKDERDRMATFLGL